MESLFCKSNEEIASILNLEKPFQAKIIYQNLIRGVFDFNAMTSLPKALRERLSAERGSALSSKVIRKEEAQSTIKLAVELADVRNLTAGEIIEQFAYLSALGERISHIVFMGMGEALANFTSAMDAIKELHREDGFGISYRKMTISTCGLVPGIRKLTELDIPVRLAVSLVSADDETRSSIMRINRAHPLHELKNALISFQRHQDRRITLEYCMLGDVNTSHRNAEELAQFCKGLDALVNLIPWNPVPELGFKAPEENEIKAFENDLKKLRISYTIRRSKGQSISGACGQLATETKREK